MKWGELDELWKPEYPLLAMLNGTKYTTPILE